MGKFWDGVKKGAGIACGTAAVCGVVGFVLAGPGGFLAGAKAGLHLGAIGGATGGGT